jgi:hypothetical protein
MGVDHNQRQSVNATTYYKNHRFLQPDLYMDNGFLGEVKNVASQGWAQQLKAYSALAQAAEVLFLLFVNQDTKLSRALLEQVVEGNITLVRMP